MASGLSIEPQQPGHLNARLAFAALACRTDREEECHYRYLECFEAAIGMSPNGWLGDDLEGNAAKTAALCLSSAAMVFVKQSSKRGSDATDSLFVADEVKMIQRARALGQRGVVAGVLMSPLQMPRHLVH